MASLNRVVITGNLVADPEVKSLPSGTLVASMRVAVNNNYRNKSGDLVEETCFIDVDLWGRRAEWIEKDCKKGSKVLVEGSLREDKWEDRDGNRRSKIKIKSFYAEHIGEPRGSGGGGGGGGGRSQSASQSTAPQKGNDFPDDAEDDLPF